ncbi:Hypothetical protein AJAP_42340 (plasmid) [Amycolatopsis japonica]|uniref:Uncharacterized protein n=1 Tax=Amycolatopsis japonica TaxID=208439 RepID=A0A075VE98_9PSEU|nr:Hypothetical protein AJAP_42340 [Amycolatopsis japonica]
MAGSSAVASVPGRGQLSRLFALLTYRTLMALLIGERGGARTLAARGLRGRETALARGLASRGGSADGDGTAVRASPRGKAAGSTAGTSSPRLWGVGTRAAGTLPLTPGTRRWGAGDGGESHCGESGTRRWRPHSPIPSPAVSGSRADARLRPRDARRTGPRLASRSPGSRCGGLPGLSPATRDGTPLQTRDGCSGLSRVCSGWRHGCSLRVSGVTGLKQRYGSGWAPTCGDGFSTVFRGFFARSRGDLRHPQQLLFPGRRVSGDAFLAGLGGAGFPGFGMASGEPSGTSRRDLVGTFPRPSIQPPRGRPRRMGRSPCGDVCRAGSAAPIRPRHVPGGERDSAARGTRAALLAS